MMANHSDRQPSRFRAARKFARVFLLTVTIAGLATAALLSAGLAMPLKPIPVFGKDMPEYVVANITIVDVEKGGLHRGMNVAVSAGRIIAVSNSLAAAEFAKWPVIDGTGKYLLPGLWDSHLHTLALSSRLHFPLLTANGVTTVRNMGDGCSWRSAFDCPPDDVAWATEGDSTTTIMPTIVASTGHHVENLESMAEVQPLVARLRKRGETFVKIQLADDTPSDVIAALFKAAAAAGLKIAGHFPQETDLADDRFAALQSLEHDNQLGPQCRRQRDGCAALLAKLARRGTAYVPTHVASSGQDARLGSRPDVERAGLGYVAEPSALLWQAYRRIHVSGNDTKAKGRYGRDLAQSLRITRAAHAAGVRVLVGTDSLDPFVVHGDSIHDEMAFLGEAGLSNTDVLRAATIRPAEFFGLGHRKGRIAPGYDADMILLDADPLANLGATRRIVGVIKGERVFAPADLAAMRSFVRQQASDLSVNARGWWALIAG